MSKPDDYSWMSPYLTVENPDKSIDFYQNAFNFEFKQKMPDDDGTTAHAEMFYKGQTVMFGKEGKYDSEVKTPKNGGVRSGVSMYLYVDDVDALYQQALEAGATSHMEPADMPWGDRMCAVTDIDGYQWSFGASLSQ